MCTGLPRYTNHSLRATYITFAIRSGLSRREIMAVTAHRSEQGIIPYER